MSSWLRELAGRPIADAGRPRLFAAACAILVAAAAVLIAIGPADPIPGPGKPPAPAPAAPQAGNPAGTTSAVPAGAERAGRRFLRGYLQFLHGTAPAAQIEAATPELRRRIARSRPRVPPAARRRRPRVAGLDGERAPSRTVALTAEIDDGGAARYPLHLELRSGSAGWRVVGVGGD